MPHVLSPRQAAILNEMGVDVWRLRGQKSLESNAEGNAKSSAGAVLASLPQDEVATLVPDTGLPVSLGQDWDALNAAIRACTKCGLHQTRTQAVCGVGNTQADWLVVGEAPGADEDAKGEPFVGRAGQLLNEMLRAIGLNREEVFIANILKCRPPDNRDPGAGEIAECLPYLRRQIELVQPKVILVVGRIAAQSLLQVTTPVGKLRGQVYEFEGLPLVVTYHPAYLLRSPTQKAKSWQDLLLAQDILKGAAG